LLSRLKPAIAAGIVAAGALCNPIAARAAPEAIELAVGAETTIALSANPSTGYRWEVSQAESSNLSAVSVSDAGFAPGGGRIGASGMSRWQIKGLRPGSATVVFVYRRSWESAAPARKHVLRVRIREQ
jgi:inhibitor of cysteine peptidase